MIPEFLHHRVLGMSEVTVETIKDFVKGILLYGLFPLVPVEFKSILPERLQSEPIVWLSEGIYQGYELGRILRIETSLLMTERLTRVDTGGTIWWVYEGLIPPSAITLLEREGG